MLDKFEQDILLNFLSDKNFPYHKKYHSRQQLSNKMDQKNKFPEPKRVF